MKYAAVALVACSVAFGVVASRLLDRKPNEVPPVAHAGNEAVARLNGEMQNMQLELRNLRLAEQLRATAGVGFGVAGSATAAPATSAVDDDHQLAEEKRRVYMAHLGEDFRREAYDNAWSMATAAQINAHLKDADVNLVALSVDCRSRTCRVELPTNAESGGKGLPVFVSRLGAALPNTVAEQSHSPSGEPTTVIYMVSGELPPDDG